MDREKDGKHAGPKNPMSLGLTFSSADNIGGVESSEMPPAGTHQPSLRFDEKNNPEPRGTRQRLASSKILQKVQEINIWRLCSAPAMEKPRPRLSES